MSYIFNFVFICVFIENISAQVYWQQPEQIHLAYGKNVYEIVVTWSTFNSTVNSVVEYGIGGLILSEEGSSKLFVDGGELKRSQYIHKVTLKNLTPNSRYGKYLFCFILIFKVYFFMVRVRLRGHSVPEPNYNHTSLQQFNPCKKKQEYISLSPHAVLPMSK